MKKILIFFRFFPSVGGTERVFTILSNYFVARGYEVCIVSTESRIAKPMFPLVKQVKLYKLPSEEVVSVENLIALHSYLMKNKIDYIINNDSIKDAVKLCFEAKKNTTAKLVTIHHGDIVYKKEYIYLMAQKGSGLKQALKKCFFPLYLKYQNHKRMNNHFYNIEKSDKYVLLSDSFRKYLPFSDKILVINNPLSYTREEFIDKKENIVVFVGRLSEAHKRVCLALTIWSKVVSAHPKWSFYIVGDGEDRLLIEEFAKKHNIANVVFTGNVESLQFYKKAKIQIMTSAFEGWPLVINEAMQNRCVPIVMHSFDSLPDIINDGKNGFIVPDNDVDYFLNKLDLLMSNESLLEEMSVNAYESTERFIPENIITQWIEMLNIL